MGLAGEAGPERVCSGVRLDLSGVYVELLTPDQSHLLTQIDDPFEEATEDRQPIPLPDAGQTGVVGQRFSQVVANIPAQAQPIGDDLQELALGTESLEEQNQL